MEQSIYRQIVVIHTQFLHRSHTRYLSKKNDDFMMIVGGVRVEMTFFDISSFGRVFR